MPQMKRSAPPDASFALRLILAVYVLVYVGLFILGYRSFFYKTALIPAFLVYAVVIRRWRRFTTDWLPLLAAVVAFDFARGGIYSLVVRGWLKPRFAYALELERFLFRTPAVPLLLQPWRSALRDEIGVMFHASHFLFFLLFGLVLWHQKREHFIQYRLAILYVMGIGLISYAAIPTVPPWLLSATGALPPITHVVAGVYNAQLPALSEAFDTNPVAAMPSLHVAVPVSCALIAQRAFRSWIRVLIWIYAAGAALSAIYLGEHYAVDVLAGALLALLSVAGAYHFNRRSD